MSGVEGKDRSGARKGDGEDECAHNPEDGRDGSQVECALFGVLLPFAIVIERSGDVSGFFVIRLFVHPAKTVRSAVAMREYDAFYF